MLRGMEICRRTERKGRTLAEDALCNLHDKLAASTELIKNYIFLLHYSESHSYDSIAYRLVVHREIPGADWKRNSHGSKSNAKP